MIFFACLNLFDDCIISIVTWVIPWFSKAFCCPGQGGRSCAKGPSPKSFDARYFDTILRFVAIYAFYKALNAWQVPNSKYTLDEGIEAIFAFADSLPTLPPCDNATKSLLPQSDIFYRLWPHCVWTLGVNPTSDHRLSSLPAQLKILTE